MLLIKGIDLPPIPCSIPLQGPPGNYVIVHTEVRKLIAYLTLKSIENQLPRDAFIKVHQSFLVCFSKIEAIEGNTIKLKNKSVPISRNYKDAVMELVVQRLLKR